MNNLKTTVLMSVYYKENADHFDDALNSIIVNQSKAPDEFILVCDGILTDELEKVITKYSESYSSIFKVFRLDKNVGLGNALNYGLEKCSNDYIIRADSDDINDEYRIELQTDYLINNPDISIVSSYIDEFEVDWRNPSHIKRVPLTNDEIVNMAKFRNPINHMSVAFRKFDILNIGSYNHAPYVEDYDLWLRAIYKGYKLANIDKVLVHARVGNGMIERRGNTQYIQSWKQLNQKMKENDFISNSEFIRNMILVRAFVYSPVWLKKIYYDSILRQ